VVYLEVGEVSPTGRPGVDRCCDAGGEEVCIGVHPTDIGRLSPHEGIHVGMDIKDARCDNVARDIHHLGCDTPRDIRGHAGYSLPADADVHNAVDSVGRIDDVTAL